MLDLNFVRENIDTVRAALANRNFPPDALNEFAVLDAERRRVIGESDAINQLRNASSKEIGALMQAGERDAAEAKKAEVAGLKEKQAELETQRDAAESAMRDILINLPNIPAADVPVGADESANIEVRKWGEPRTFAFEPKDHVDLGERLGILDLERATKIARDMVTRYGMTDALGPMVYAENEGEVFLGRSVTKTTNMSEQTMQKVDAEVRRIIDQQYTLARKLIEDNQDKMHAMAKALLEWETIDSDQLDDIMAGKEPRAPKDWTPRSSASGGDSGSGGAPAARGPTEVN